MASNEQLSALLNDSMADNVGLLKPQEAGGEGLNALVVRPQPPDGLGSLYQAPETQSHRERKRQRRDPNRARNARGLEIRELKREVEALTEILKKARVCAKEHGSEWGRPSSQLNAKGTAAANVWKEIAHSQQGQRMRSETENARLRRTLAALVDAAIGLQHAAAKATHSMLMHRVGCDLSSRVQALLLDSETDAKRFEMMLQEVDASYNEMDAVFRLNGLLGASDEPRSGVCMREGSHRRFLDMYAENILPFPLSATSKVIWEFYRGPAKHRGQLYFKTAKTLNSSHETVVEKFALEQHANTAKVDFRFWQVLRRHVEGERVLIVWMGIAEPVEFTHKRVSSCGYIQKGYVLCERVADQFTRLRRCHRTTPYVPYGAGAPLRNNTEREISAIIEWNLRLDAVRAHLRYFENELLRETLRQKNGDAATQANKEAWWVTS